MGNSLDMHKGPKGIDYIVHHIALGLWNREMQKFLENDLISGSYQFQDIASKKEHYED